MMDACSRDAISCLPDELLRCILSILSTKDVALTSLLSKNLRNVIRLVDNLDFDDSVSLHAGEDKQARYVFPESFKNFVDQTLALQFDVPIKKVSLKCHVGEELVWTAGYLKCPGCPVLEELSVHHDGYTERRKIISSPTIKKLSLHCRNCRSFIYSSSYVSFDTPSLIYLDYSDYALRYYPKCNLKSLVEARIDLKKLNLPDVTNFVVGIRNVHTLHLSPDSVDVITLNYNGLPMFDNLVKLSFGSNKKRGWKLLPYLLQQSPKLETLIIQDLRGYADDVSVPENKVKVLHILSYGGSSEELKNLENFLEKLEFLESVEVKVRDNGKILQTKSDLMMMLPRVSLSNCKIQVL